MKMTTRVETHPIDFEALRKGDFVSPETIELAFGCYRASNPNGYRFKVMELKGQIERKRGDLKCAGELDGLRVLHDHEVGDYLTNQIELARRRMSRNRDDFARVEISNLDDAQRRRLETQMLYAGSVALAANRAARETRRQLGVIGPMLLAPEIEEGEDGDTN